MATEIQIMYRRGPSGRMEAYCPACGEELQAVDVEIFPYCPFCNQALSRDSRMEDFILDPVIRHWIGQSNGYFVR